MKQNDIPYERQIFVCTNDCGGEKASCGDQRGLDVFRALRTLAKERGLHPRVRVAQATCLGQCSMGVNVMVFPDNIWYSHVGLDEIEIIADRYLTA